MLSDSQFMIELTGINCKPSMVGIAILLIGVAGLLDDEFYSAKFRVDLLSAFGSVELLFVLHSAILHCQQA